MFKRIARLPLASVFFLCLSACGGGGGGGGGATTSAIPPPRPPAETAELRDTSQFTATAPETFVARFDTSQGVFRVAVTRSFSPLGADRFYNLVLNGYYDEVCFFRVVPNFVVQFGISGSPEVSAVWREQRIDDEPVIQSNLRGFITYAKSSAPDSRTTQVFINLKDNSGLDSQGFSPFGQVIEGMDVVDALFSGYGESPRQDRIQIQGNAYLISEFPQLDFVIEATIE